MPSPWDKDLWRDLPVDLQPGKYSVSIGVVEIAENKKIKVNCYDIIVGNAEPHLIGGLFSHFSTSGLTKFVELVGEKGKLQRLINEAGQYFQALLMFLSLIVDEVKGYKTKVSFHDEVEPGLTKWFVMTAWNDALQKPGGYSWIDDSWYKPPERIPGTNLWQLKCGAYDIGIAKSEKTLNIYRNLHKKLRLKYAEHPLSKDINTKNQELNIIVQDVRQRFQEFSDIQHLPGNCELCL